MSYKEMWDGFAAKAKRERSNSRDSMGRIEIDRTIHTRDWEEGYRTGVETGIDKMLDALIAKNISGLRIWIDGEAERLKAERKR